MAFGDIVQSKTGRTDQGGASTLQVTFDSGPTEGNLLVAGVVTRDADQDTPSGWTLAKSQDDTPGADNLSVFYKIAGASESSSVTFDDGASGQVIVAVCYEVEGSFDGTPLDKTNSTLDSDGGTSIATGTTGTLSQADEFAFAAYTNKFGDGDDPSAESVDSSFTLQDSEFAGYAFASTDNYPSYIYGCTRLVSATTALNPSLSWTTASVTGMAIIATFKKSGGATYPIPEALHSYRQRRV